ncbi:unnamed protein product, partial [marine sediment metagenome]
MFSAIIISRGRFLSLLYLLINPCAIKEGRIQA